MIMSSKNLQMSLKTKWFEMTKQEIDPKTEDYRDLTPYWCSRFLLFRGKSYSKEWWFKEFFEYGTIEDVVENIDLFCTYKPFTQNIMTLGYPSKNDKKRILTLEHKGIEIREGREEWGAEKGKIYFVIKHGKRIEQ
jgi:hypothetical protein